MKNLKLLILVFGVLGLASLFLPMGEGAPSMFSLLMAVDKLELVMMLAAFGIPTAVAALGAAKPPAPSWHAIAALAGFALAAVKVRIWQTAPHIMDAPTSMKLLLVAVIGGVLVSLVGVVKPEPTA